MTSCLSFLRRRPGNESDEDSLCDKPTDVNGEYLQAFRTKSYVEICNKAQEKTTTTALSSTTSSSLPTLLNLTEYLLEPQQEIVIEMIENFKVHNLLVDYFEASLEACLCCDTILESIRQTRLAYKRIKNVVNLSERDQGRSEKNTIIIYKELASFALQNNQLSNQSNPVEFRDIHEKHMVLLDRLNLKRKKLLRRIRIKRVCKKVGEIGLVITQGAILVAVLVFALHSIVGLVVVPYVIGGILGLNLRRKIFKLINKKNSSKRLYEQIDVAARGVYIVINDLDTMSRMVKRLEDDVQHWREVADICVKNGKCEVLKQVVKEFRDYQINFLDQLEEVEEHVYLCFLTINRSRRLVMQQITDSE